MGQVRSNSNCIFSLNILLCSYSLTLIDALDTLVVMGNKTEFEKGVWWLVDNLNFDKDKNVSLFETNIRVVGGNINDYSFVLQF